MDTRDSLLVWMFVSMAFISFGIFDREHSDVVDVPADVFVGIESYNLY